MKNYQPILSNVARHLVLGEEEEKLFVSLLQAKKVPAGALLLRQEDQCRELYFVSVGALRACVTDKKDRESTVMFALPDWWITDMFSFVNGCPAMMRIEAITDSEVLLIRKNELDHLLERVPKFERYFRILMQNAYTREQLRMIGSLTLPAIDRYQDFLKKYPQAAALITQKQLASYLGISPEFLSSIKTKPGRPT